MARIDSWAWTVGILGGVALLSPGCSEDETSPAPRSKYLALDGVTFWDGPPPEDAKLVAPLPDDATFPIILVLPYQRPSLESQALEVITTISSGQLPTFMTAAEVASDWGASSADISAVEASLKEASLISVVASTGIFVTTQITVAQAEKLFCVGLNSYSRTQRSGTVTLRGTTDTPCVPITLQGHVQAILGLTQSPTQFSGSALPNGGNTRTGTPDGCADGQAPGGFTPNQLLDAFGIQTLHEQGWKGQGMRIAVGVCGFTPARLVTYQKCFDLAALDVTTHFAAQSDCIEAYLDLEMINIVAPEAQVDVYEIDGDVLQAVLALDAAVAPASPGGSAANAFTASFGTCETEVNPALQGLLDAMLMSASIVGTSTFFSSGDTGSIGYCPGSGPAALSVSLPASSPWTTAVGATNLALEDVTNAITGEGVWNVAVPPVTGQDAQASGGGVSVQYVRPAYQWGPGITASAGRLVPDVVTFGSGAPGIAYYGALLEGVGWGVSGGTSAASPWLASLSALFQQATGSRLGHFAPYLYEASMSDYAAYFLDVQAGDNRVTPEATCCYAGPNYDMASGLGSLQPTPFLQFLKGIQAASPPAP